MTDIHCRSLAAGYAARITRFIDVTRQTLCECRFKILDIKWSHWVRWYLSKAEELHTMSQDEVRSSLDEVFASYSSQVDEIDWVSKGLFRSFETIHQCLRNEMTMIILDRVNGECEANVVLVGELLFQLAKNSAYEMQELRIPCAALHDGTCHDECPFFAKHGHFCTAHWDLECQSTFTMMVNDFYNVNGWAVDKVLTVAEAVLKQPKEITLNLDFTFYKTFHPKTIKNLLIAGGEYFKNVMVSNVRTANMSEFIKYIAETNKISGCKFAERNECDGKF